MGTRPARTIGLIALGAAVVVLAVALILAVVPEAESALVAVGFGLGVITYGALYVLQRRLHW
jgi:hypothetical protein